ncbi:MAG: type II toxin-antitoxin system RelE/ParE family toxin [Paludibacteraceae bacterium]
MNIEYANSALKELFEEGKTSDKRYKKLAYPVVKQYISKVNYLRSANRIEDLYKIKSLHYEKKKGDLQDIEAIWINDQYRLLFQSTEGVTFIITEVLLLEISKHYGD